MMCKTAMFGTSYYSLRDVVDAYKDLTGEKQRMLLDDLLKKYRVPEKNREIVVKTWDGCYLTFGYVLWKLMGEMEVKETVIVNPDMIIVRVN